MSKLNDQIKTEIAKENPDYFALLELYSQHPEAKRNIVKVCEQRFRHSVQQRKLIYECEKLVAKKFSGKRAVIVGNNPGKPITIQREVHIEAPPDFEYEIKFEDLPKDLQKLAVEKGQLYNKLDIDKKRMGAITPKNDDKSVQERKVLRDRMEETADRIKVIHAYLKQYDNPELQAKIKARNENIEKITDLEAEFKEIEKGSDTVAMEKFTDNLTEIIRLKEKQEKFKDKDIERFDELSVEISILDEENQELLKKFDKKIYDKLHGLTEEALAVSIENKSIQKEIDDIKTSFEFNLEDLEKKEEVIKKYVAEWDAENLDKEYKYKEMSWAERKLLLKKLQSQVPKQLERAKSSAKEETRQKNATEAIKGQTMINILQDYFNENPEDFDKK